MAGAINNEEVEVITIERKMHVNWVKLKFHCVSAMCKAGAFATIRHLEINCPKKKLTFYGSRIN